MVILERIVIDDPGNSGANGLAIRKGPGAGASHVTMTGSSVTLVGSPGLSTTAVEMPEAGSLAIDGLTLVMTGDARGFGIGGSADDIVFSLTDSSITLDAPAGPFSSTLGGPRELGVEGQGRGAGYESGMFG